MPYWAKDGGGGLTAFGVADSSAVRLALITYVRTFVLERNGVGIQMESGLVVRGGEIDWVGEGFDPGVVVLQLQVLDGLIAVFDSSVDADADAGLGLESEGSAQSDDLGDLHDGSCIGW